MLRKVCFSNETIFTEIYNSVLESYIRAPSRLPESLIFELVGKAHSRRRSNLPFRFFAMPLTYFGATSESQRFDGDGAIAFEIQKYKRNVRLTGFPTQCAASCTVHNAQGATFNAVSIARMRTHGNRPE